MRSAVPSLSGPVRVGCPTNVRFRDHLADRETSAPALPPRGDPLPEADQQLLGDRHDRQDPGLALALQQTLGPRARFFAAVHVALDPRTIAEQDERGLSAPSCLSWSSAIDTIVWNSKNPLQILGAGKKSGGHTSGLLGR